MNSQEHVTAFVLLAMIVTHGPVYAKSPPPELVGTWAASAADCRRLGPSTVTITASSVQWYQTSGRVTGGWREGLKTIEVVFEPAPGRPHGREVRTYALAADGKALLEMKGSEILVKRTRCEGTPE
jgi:hypothetical protein